MNVYDQHRAIQIDDKAYTRLQSYDRFRHRYPSVQLIGKALPVCRQWLRSMTEYIYSFT